MHSAGTSAFDLCILAGPIRFRYCPGNVMASMMAFPGITTVKIGSIVSLMVQTDVQAVLIH